MSNTLADKSKKKNQNNGANGKASIDPSEYIRQPIELPEIQREETPEQTAHFKNIELLFPEWNIIGEPWSDPLEHEETISYPQNLNVCRETTITAEYGLDEEIKTKDKKKINSAGKTKRGTVTSLEEQETDEHGRPLPRIFVDESSNTYDQYTWDRGFRTSEDGHITDEDMSAVFKIILKFSPSIYLSDSAVGQDILWNSIYPKNQSFIQGKPCYNPSGRYCVRLFFAGKWRKVYVDEKIPLREDGSWALCRSSSDFELWPTILSKAIYSAYSQSRYVEFNTEVNISPEKRKTSFISFALYALTGWLPNLPLDIAAALHGDPHRIQGIVQEIVFGGAAVIEHDNIPGSKPIENYNRQTEMQRAAKDPNGYPLKTMKLFKHEYDSRKEEYLQALESRNDREVKIAAINSQLVQKYHECYVINYRDDQGRYHTLPILGVCFPSSKTTNSSADGAVEDISFLMDWKIISPGDDQSPRAFEDSDNTTIHFPSLPSMTELSMRWMTVGELAAKGAFVFSLETMNRTPLSAQLGWHWRPQTVKAENTRQSAQANKSVVKSKDSQLDNAIKPDAVCTDPGALPFVLMTLDTASFFERVSEDITDQTLYDPDIDVHMDRYRPKSSHLSISVAIHADMMSIIAPPASPSNVVTSPLASPRTGQKSMALPAAPKNWRLLDDVVVVLQELRDDGQEPLVMRLELPAAAPIPLTRATFHIPAERLPNPETKTNNPMKKFIFWIRLLSKSSVYLTFKSSININVGEASQMWSSLSNTTSDCAGTMISKEGRITGPIRPNSEKLLFRLPLAVDSSEFKSEYESQGTAGEQVIRGAKVFAFLHISDPNIAKNVSLIVLSPNSDQATFADSSSTTLPRLFGNSFVIPWTITENAVSRILAARICGTSVIQPFKWSLILISSNKVIDISNRINPIQPAPRGSLSNNPSLAISTANSFETKTYEGPYIPNNNLQLFRDVYSIEKSSFPLAFKLMLIQPALPSDMENSLFSSSMDTMNDVSGLDEVCLVVRIYRKNDRKLITEYRGRSIIQAYNIELDTFKRDDTGIVDSINAATGNKNAPTIEYVDIIVQCCIDESKMHVPSSWRDRKPYYFTSNLTNTATTSNPVGSSSLLNGSVLGSNINSICEDSMTEEEKLSKFQWRMEILSGNVLNVGYDTYDLERYNNMKLSWEERSPGRAEQAKAALEAYNMRKQLANPVNTNPLRSFSSLNSPPAYKPPSQGKRSPRKNNGRQSSVASEVTELAAPSHDILIDLIGVALKKDKETMHKRYDIIKTITRYKEYIAPVDSEVVFVTQKELSENRQTREQQVEENENQINNIMSQFESYNTRLKDHCNNRIEQLIQNIQESNAHLQPYWERRELYKKEIDSKNQALRMLLDKGQEAIKQVDSEKETKTSESKKVAKKK